MDDLGQTAFPGRNAPPARHRAAGRAILAIGLALPLAAIAFFLTGCEDGGESGAAAAAPGYLPDWDEARGALESVLNAWRDAQGPLPTSFVSDSVKVIDNQRRPDQRLKAHAVLGRVDLPNARQFTVRLELEGEDEPRLVRYNVLGRSPIWVFRLEDFEMIAHWEHPMGDDENAPPSTSGQARNAPRAEGGPAAAGPPEASQGGALIERPGPVEGGRREP